MNIQQLHLREYANGLIDSWNNDKLTVFPFLLAQADQGDLEEVKKDDEYKEDQEFRKAIDDAFPKAGPAGERHERLLNRERAKLAMKIFSEIGGLEPLDQEKALGGIIGSYLVGGSEGTKSEK